MSAGTEGEELGALAASLREVVAFLREQGLDELLEARLTGVSDATETAAPGRDEPEPRPASRPSAPRAEPVGRNAGPAGEPPELPATPDEALAALRSDIGECTRCPLHEARTNIVFGEGDAAARLVFVGEGPGQEEDRLGRPFVGPAGRLLTKIIEAIGLDRREVYICNVVKCRPPRNRVPEPVERRTCGRFLDRQLDIIGPEVIVCLGATAAGYLLETDAPVGRLRGRFHDRAGARVMATYHPAYLLRSPEAKRPVWEDMKLVRDRLGGAR